MGYQRNKKYILVKDKIYKKMVQEKDKNRKTHEKSKKYRNELTDLLKTSEQAHSQPARDVPGTSPEGPL